MENSSLLEFFHIINKSNSFGSFKKQIFCT
jgi:hypothetical protein